MTEYDDASRAIEKLLRERPERLSRILANHGARIEAKAAVLTPVDTGMLRRANEYHIKEDQDEVTLTIANRMVYAHYQHENVLHHTQPKARDHFISIPFEDELPAIIDEIIKTDIEEATTQ